MKLSKKMGFVTIALGAALLAGCGATTDTSTGATNAGASAVDEQTKNENIIPVNEVVIDNDIIKATLVEIETTSDDIWGNERKVIFDVENKSDQDIILQSEKVSSDGKMVNDKYIIMSTDVAAGKQAESELQIVTFDEEMPVLEKDFEMTLKVLSSDFDRIGEYPVKVDVSNK